jgi:hypothetical protein
MNISFLFMPRMVSIMLGLLMSACATGPQPDWMMSTRLALDNDHSPFLHGEHPTNTVFAMASPKAHFSPHWRWTPKRPSNPEDQLRAEQIVQTLRDALTPYRDYQVAMEHGFRPFLHNVPLANFHFMSHWRGFMELYRFNPAEPTALLYRKTANGVALKGAMYTAPEGASAETLHERIPLSMTRWHAHVDLCFPPPAQSRNLDWSLYGPTGSIQTKEACAKASGVWFPEVFGWMVHVYPFEDSPEKIWAH